jgi:Cof subfamily protein (haloacid dehalogenase superfamily)
MQVKLICSDIDGTLLNKERELSEKSISVIKKMAPTPLILISSRMPQAMEHLQQELDISHLPLIAYNGGLTLEQGTVLDSTEIDLNLVEAITVFCSERQIHASLYHRYQWYVAEMDYWAKRESNNTKVAPQVQPVEQTIAQWQGSGNGAHKIMCMGDPLEIDQLASFIQKKYHDQVIGYRSKPTYLEISPARVSKKTALEELMKFQYQGLSLNNVMAFGDNFNDIDMLDAVGMGVAVKNANSEVLAVADRVTETNTNDGVAIFLERELSL